MKNTAAALSWQHAVRACLLMLFLQVSAAQAATPGDNQDLVDEMSFLTGALDTSIAAGIIPFDPVSRPAEFLEYETNLALKALAPALLPPGEKTFYPDPDSSFPNNYGCHRSLSLPDYDSEYTNIYYSNPGYWAYSNWFGFWDTEPLPSRGEWGVIGTPQVLHSNTDVRLRLDITGDVDRDGTYLRMAEGSHSFNWQADTMTSPFWDGILPLTLMAFNSSVETKYGTAAASKAAKVSAKAAAKIRKALIKAAANVAEFAGLQAVEYGVDQTGFSDALPTFSNYASQPVTVWDTHTPHISTNLPEITLEARDFGGLRYSRAAAELHDTLDYFDDCGRNVSVSSDAPSFFSIGTTTITWSAHDGGPYPPHIPSSSSITQTVHVVDTQAPLLVPPAGFARESDTDIDLTAGTFSLGKVLVADLADPNPTVTRNAPDTLQPGHRYAITYTATDASGNSTRAPQDAPEKYTQIVTIKQPGTNTAPTANNNSAATITSKPVAITLNGVDTDFLDGRYDPLEFIIVDRPGNGEFVAPLLPYFIEDFRAKPTETPVGNDWQNLACPVDLGDSKQLEAKLGALSPGVHMHYIDKCYRGIQKPPTGFVYKPRFMHITDDEIYYISDYYWYCQPSDCTYEPRVAKFFNGKLLAEYRGDAGFDGIFQVDEQKNIWWTNLNGAGSSTDMQITGLDENLIRLDVPLTRVKYHNTTEVGDYQINAASLVNSHVDRQRGIVYVFDDYHIFMFDYDSPLTFLGLVGGEKEYPCEGFGGYSQGGYWMETDSRGNLYQVCNSRVYKFSAPTNEGGSRAAGNLVGWMGRCRANRIDPVTKVKYNYCDEERQIAKGFQCTDETCEVDPYQAYGDAPGQFDAAIHLTVDPNDILYVVDHNNDRVQRFLPDGTFAGQAKSTGAGVASDGSFVLGNMGKPRHVSVNSKEFHVLESNSGNNDFFLHIFKTLPFYDITPNSVKVDYVSEYNFQGQDLFTYLVDDGIAKSVPATVTIDVARAYRAPENPRVVCYTDNSFSVVKACELDEDTALYLRLHADDLDGFSGFGGLDVLTYNIETAPEHGQLSLLDTQADHADYRYDPDADYFGQDGFSFQVYDGNDYAAAAGELSFNVIPVNDQPSLIFPDEIRVARGFAAPIKFEFSDVDRESFPQPAVDYVDWGDGVVATPSNTPPWNGIGIRDHNGDPMDPRVNIQPGSGYIVGAHVYDANAAGIQVCVYTPTQDDKNCQMSPAVQVIEATQVSISAYEDETTPLVPVEPAKDFYFRAFVSNDKPQTWTGLTANNVQTSFSFPQGVEVIWRDPRCGTGNPAVCSLGNMAAGDRKAVEFILNIDPTVAAENYTFAILTELVDDGPRVTDKNVASLTIQVADDDHDGTINYYDQFPNDPRGATDADQDGMADEWEQSFGLNSQNAADAALDSDGDGASNLQEFINGSSPFLADAVQSSEMLTIAQGGDDRLGIHVAAGDINGDGFSDVVAGAPGYNNKQGAFVIYYGSSAGVTASAPVMVDGTSGFGRIVAVGNINNDKYADIVVKTNEDTYLYLGAAGNTLSEPVKVPRRNNSASSFGTAIVIADIDNDQLADLLITSPEDGAGGRTRNGVVYIYRASSQYWTKTDPAPDMLVSANQDNLALGDSLVVYDINGDKVPDIMAGAAFAGNGLVYGFLGHSIDWSKPEYNNYDIIMGGAAGTSSFAYSLASGVDVDGDEIADLLVGAYGTDGQGAAYLYRSSDQYWMNDPMPIKIAGHAAGDQLGVSVALLPAMTYSGEPTIVVGSNRAERDQADVDEGRVDIYSISNNVTPLFTAYGTVHDMLGYSVANAGDVNGDGENDIVMGAPDIRTGGDGGYIRLYYAGKTAKQTDTDGDQIADEFDNCINVANTDQTDTDGDGSGDFCDDSPQGGAGGGGNGGGTGGGGGGGGCTVNPAAKFDPLLPLFILLGALYLLHGRYRARS